MTTNNKQQNDASGIRLKEILGVLKKHHITSGIQPEKLRQILEDLGPTYVKLGQIMSMRSDMLPESYCKELERLRTDVKPLPFDVIQSEIEKELGKPADVFLKKYPLNRWVPRPSPRFIRRSSATEIRSLSRFRGHRSMKSWRKTSN